MSSKVSLALLVLLVGAFGVPAAHAAADTAGSAAAAKAQQAKKAKQAKAQQAKLARGKAAQQQQKKDEWYAKDRDRGLDIAARYAPDEIARVRKNNYIAKGDTVKTGNGKRGWRHYMDKYYSR